ncbi:MAG: FlgD immunoglobulin-like domain containing protein [Acidimicrobiia bacterium]
MRRPIAILVALAAIVVPALPASAVPTALPPSWSPDATWSTDGDFATDVYGDPWDFSNDEDVIPTHEVGVQAAAGITRLPSGQLSVDTVDGTTIRLVFNWPNVIPWGRDGRNVPINGDRYSRLSFSAYADAPLAAGIRFQTASGAQGVLPFALRPGWNSYAYNLNDPANYPAGFPSGPWSGQIVNLELHRGGGSGTVNVQLDWVRLHRPDTPDTPPAPGSTPQPVVLSPNAEGGEDYATAVRGNPWDMAAADDVLLAHDLANVGFGGGDMSGATIANDPYVLLPTNGPIDGDKYHRATVDACYDGGFSLANAPGGGMVGRFAWETTTIPQWTETQDFVVFPGCHRITFDMKTDPAGAVHDESSVWRPGWAGQSVTYFRYDLNEDPGARGFTLRDIRLADDAAFSTTYPISFIDTGWASGTTAEIYASTIRGALGGSLIGSVNVGQGVNTFTWNGTNTSGARLPNGTYWITIRMSRGGRSTTAVASGPLRYEPPQPSAPGYYVPLTPFRLLDTRDGTGGVISPLGHSEDLELDVTGVGGVPETGVRGVVMNVTVDGPTNESFLTVWPADQPLPLAANLNFLPGQTVPNLVAVKTGANGKVKIFNKIGLVNVIADVVGYYSETAPQSGGRYTPLTPSRVLDTRDGTGTGGSTAPIGAGGEINVKVTGTNGVPATGVSGVAINVTVDQPTGSSFLTVWPTGEPRPLAATHNFVPGLTVANLVLAKVGAGGNISIYNLGGGVHVVGDIVGYFSASGGQFVPLVPHRILDTRDGTGTGGSTAPVGQQTFIDLQVSGQGGVPSSGATGAVINITATESSLPTFVTAWPTGEVRPTAASSNPRPGVAVPNLAYAKLGAGGKISLWNNTGTTHLVGDVVGYIM